MADAGFLIEGTVYPFPTSFRLCDPVLVSKLTGMPWGEFVEAITDGDASDPTTMVGMVGVAVWQANPRWSRDKVIRYVENLSMDALDVQDDGEDDAAPPAVAATEEASVASPEASSPEPKSPLDATVIPDSTGTSASATTSPAFNLVA